LLASSAALSLVQNAAWATCSDGTTFPAGGFVIGGTQVPTAANWSQNVFTAAAGSVFIPDASVNEANDPTKPLTGGGHNWVFDAGSSLCKVGDAGSAAGTTGWILPPHTSPDCIDLPIVNNNGILVAPGDFAIQGGAITPTCDPTTLASANNTYFNQLGCSISHGVARDAQHATTYLFVVGGKGRLIMVALDNVPNPQVGGDAGKEVSNFGFYTALIPSGQTFTNAAISPDGRFAMVTSDKKLQTVFACLNPLGDPGDPTKPINPNFTIPALTGVPVGQPLPATVPCMQVGNNNLAVDMTTGFGPDNQPYFGGQRLTNPQNTVVNSFNGVPGGASKAAWPNCIWQTNGSLSLADAFAHKRQNGCNNAAANVSVSSPLMDQATAFVSHGSYIYLGATTGPVLQVKVTTDPISGLSTYASRSYLNGLGANHPVTGLGVADDLGSLMVMTDPSIIGLLGQGVVTKLPLCEDMQ